MFRFVGVRKLWLWQSFGNAAAVRALIGQQEFRNVEDVVRTKKLVEVWLRQVQCVMSLEPCAQLGRDLQALDKLIAGRDGVFLFYFLDYFRIAPREDVKRKLAHRLRPR